MRVLVVEDDHISAMVIREILAPLGVAEVAENGLVAVSKFRNALERGESYEDEVAVVGVEGVDVIDDAWELGDLDLGMSVMARGVEVDGGELV